MNIEPVPFNRGFFSIDLTYTFRVELMAYERACGSPTLLTGTAYAGKNVILYGGESSSKTFFSNGKTCSSEEACSESVNLPTAAVQVVEPNKGGNGLSACSRGQQCRSDSDSDYDVGTVFRSGIVPTGHDFSANIRIHHSNERMPSRYRIPVCGI